MGEFDIDVGEQSVTGTLRTFQTNPGPCEDGGQRSISKS